MLPTRVYISMASADDKETEMFEQVLTPQESHLLALLSSALGEHMGATKHTPSLLFYAGMIQLGRLAAEMQLAKGFVDEAGLMAALGFPAPEPAPKSQKGGRKAR